MFIPQQDLRHYNTFGISIQADQFAELTEPDQLGPMLDAAGQAPALILGGGSNILLLGDIPGWVLHNAIRFIDVHRETSEEVVIKVGGGLNWHQLVLHSLRQGWSGIENLALIPGTVGAAPIQNIGAYGVELEAVFEQLEAIELATGQRQTFGPADCQFGYRYSCFKDPAMKGRFLITAVYLRLRKSRPELRTEYGAIQQQLSTWHIADPTPADVAAAVIEIRRSKLPDWLQLGNAGSFFKNPLVSAQKAAELQQVFPNIPAYPQGTGKVKLAAGWLIDQCGWKGKREGKVGCYEKQALVIVNHGGASGQEVLAFSDRITKDVEDRFGVQLEREVNTVGALTE